MLQDRNVSSGIAFGFDGSGAPNRDSSTAAPRSRARRTASTARSTPFDQSMRATTATRSGGRGGSGMGR